MKRHNTRVIATPLPVNLIETVAPAESPAKIATVIGRFGSRLRSAINKIVRAAKKTRKASMRTNLDSTINALSNDGSDEIANDQKEEMSSNLKVTKSRGERKDPNKHGKNRTFQTVGY